MSRPAVVVLAIMFLCSALVPPVFAQGMPRVADLVDSEYTAVVNISTVRPIDPRYGGLPPGFGDLPGDRGGFDDSASLGSGFLISDDGYILTNSHVVEDAEEIIVRLHDRRQYVAELVGFDERSDVALLKIDATGLPRVRIGDASVLRVGEWVVAIGSPFGFDHSVTVGIVSAMERSLPADHYVPFIQTDVAINPGNSGGPLYNMSGEVVGVNAQIFSRTGGFMGLSFAIPIDIAMDVGGQLRDDGEVSWGWLGVAIREVSHDQASELELDSAHGALVRRVIEGSPAASAGIEVGDVIVRYDGRRVSRSASLPPMVGRTAIGRTVDVEVVRDSESLTLPVEIRRIP